MRKRSGVRDMGSEVDADFFLSNVAERDSAEAFPFIDRELPRPSGEILHIPPPSAEVRTSSLPSLPPSLPLFLPSLSLFLLLTLLWFSHFSFSLFLSPISVRLHHWSPRQSSSDGVNRSFSVKSIQMCHLMSYRRHSGEAMG